MSAGTARSRLAGLLAVAGLFAGFAATSSATAAPAPFGHPCTTQSDGTRFCPTTDAGPGQTVNGVPSFDRRAARRRRHPAGEGGTPLPDDRDAARLRGTTRPPSSRPTPNGDGSVTYHYDNDYFARQGYAVRQLHRARVLAHSCGGGPQRLSLGALWAGLHPPRRHSLRGARHAVSARTCWSTRKSPSPSALGVTGISYGGGQSVELAYLRNRTALPDGVVRALEEPSWQVSFPSAPPGRAGLGPDLVDSLLPKRALPRHPGSSFQVRAWTRSGLRDPQLCLRSLRARQRSPATTVATLPASSPCTNLDADLYRRPPRWSARASPSALRGPGSIVASEILLRPLTRKVDGIPGSPAPLLIENGWTDDLFPPEQAIRIYNQEQAE